ncbi:polysaccharide deacetylase family protein [Marivita sp. GX14005]|uniref:polysaccharide deacetylase family protein n=1 Tax=Marivita sp. GX14005 TaxID=2942276 RepID=UPI002019E6C4|nr:polysaccharide deacetylase family protein [Marivita sp. GX14005]MCL3883115.1 polysaccharide deacetylase family protein [Marivita sp. GX14005]
MPSAIRFDAAERLSDLRGYGETPPDPRWPDGARMALSLVLNIEEGSERHIDDGDSASEHLNTDMVCEPIPGQRNLNLESHYEYGSRVGVWRLLDLFRDRGLPITAFAVGQALERVPQIGHRLVADGHEIAAHGWRWIDYRDMKPEEEAEHIAKTIQTIAKFTGAPPAGWYTGRVSAQTRKLVLERGGFLYDSDAYNDDLPYWIEHGGGRHLVLPYAFDTNDMRFAAAPGFVSGRDWCDYLIDSFDQLWSDGARRPGMMSVGLHCRLAGRPGRLRALARFLDHVAKHEGVWIARRVDIAHHWHKHHAPVAEPVTA